MLDAREAGRLTDAALDENSEVTKPFLEHVEARVRRAAKEGMRSIVHPFSSLGDNPPCLASSPSVEVRDTVRKVLMANGYRWEDHPDPDPGSPTSGPYTTVSW